MNKVLIFICGIFLCVPLCRAQDYRWQQRVEYVMDVTLDDPSHILRGTQKLTYYNNSPDTLEKVYYHLYFNAFQPGSMMDVRSRTIADPDLRIGNRISKLTPSEQGYQSIETLTQDGKPVSWTIHETVMEVALATPLLPGTKTEFNMTFRAQVPIQIRRSGRDSDEGISYSMTQWYPKLAEYDEQGWHADPYIAREFYGVWGDFDVTIHIDNSFTIAATGILQNPEEVGHGYATGRTKKIKGMQNWHFVASKVHDFAWAADPDYIHEQVKVPGGPVVHFFFQDSVANWKAFQPYIVRHFQYMNKTYGQYPYESYSVIQGGDGGMEYPMCTLITGKRTMVSLAGASMHEISHSWFQGVLGSNESLYPWMDEGFTEFCSNESFALAFNQPNPHAPAYKLYAQLAKSNVWEPASLHSDQYKTNAAYTVVAYCMGELLLDQLKYIMGDETFYAAMHVYFEQWKFRHPEPNDFIRVMEKKSSLQLSWFLRYWINDLKTIDYAVGGIAGKNDSTEVRLQRKGAFPMPTEVRITLKNGSSKLYVIPSSEMMGCRPLHEGEQQLKEWPWVNPDYTFTIDTPSNMIDTVMIDPENKTADIERGNNIFPGGAEITK